MRANRQIVAAIVATTAAFAVAIYLKQQHATSQASPSSTRAAAIQSEPIGSIDRPVKEAAVSNTIDVAGWALDHAGVRDVQVRLPDTRLVAKYRLPRPDVGRVKLEYRDADRSGFELRHTLLTAPPMRLPYDVVVTTTAGVERVLGRRSLIPPNALELWSAWRSEGPAFHFLMATSGVAKGGAVELDSVYDGYGSSTQRIGVAVPILYLRSTRGRSGDWIFDPDFDTRHKCGARAIVDDSLRDLIQFSVTKRVPIQFILNGGIWADATCNTPEWDVNDHLEEDIRNCQWTQDNQVPPDDYLKNLAGSTASPELARSLTLNVYARDVRRYKKRNLQTAARLIADFGREHPDLFVGVNLDSDTYTNPFFEQREWFDYNPDTLRQFREWLSGTGPYAGSAVEGVPDLRAWRRSRPLTLAEVNRMAGTAWKRWADVDPPRRFPGSEHQALQPGESRIWDDPWYREWDTFRKHLVALHYDDLARWTHEAGIPKERIFTAQGFVSPEGPAKPFAVRITSAGQNYDSGGVSVEGAIPRHGHLGAILYGPAARNDARMEHRHGLFATFARMDPGWAVVESNMADLKRPDRYPAYEQAYRAFRDLFNYEARQVSLMAWNGSNGIFAGQPGYVSYTSWRNTPAEEAMRDHMVARAHLPIGSRLWTFGSAQHADDDGWTVEGGRVDPQRGRLHIAADKPIITMLSPGDQVIRPRNARSLVLGIDREVVQGVDVHVEGAPGAGWIRIGSTANDSALPERTAGFEVPLTWPLGWSDDRIAERVRIELRLAATTDPITLHRVALIGTTPTAAR